jgi:uncharacterized protein
MVADLKLLIQLQDLDKKIEETKREIAALPKHISAIEKTLETHVRKLEADRAALLANQRDRKQLESEIQVQEQKISKLKNQMLEAKTNEQYAAFKKEIEFCENAIHKFEDRILDRMAESEPLEANVKVAETALAREKKHVEAEKQAARERTAIDQQLLKELLERRQQTGPAIAPPLLAAYERVRRRWGSAVAEAVDGRCSACHLALRLQFYQELRQGEEVKFCESCGRVLFYTPPAIETDEVGPEALPTENQQI